MCVCTRLRSPQCGASATCTRTRNHVCACTQYVYRLRHVRFVHLETAVSARESKFIEPHDSSIRSSLLCQAIYYFSRGTELEITVKHPMFCNILLFSVVPIRNIVREWDRISRSVAHILERPFLGRINHVHVFQFRVATFITVTAGTI